MSNRITALRTQHHSEFLSTQRQDPVTRKVFVAGDRITLCATCLLPFLEESWCAIGGTHCGQFATTGLEAFEAPTETPANEGNGDSAAANKETPSYAEAVAAGESAGVKLNPIPIRLLEVPISLRQA